MTARRGSVSRLLLAHQAVAGGCACGWIQDSNKDSIWQDHVADILVSQTPSQTPSNTALAGRLRVELERAVRLLTISQRRELAAKTELARLRAEVDPVSGDDDAPVRG